MSNIKFQEQIKKAIEEYVASENKKKISDNLDKAWDKYWCLFYDLLTERKCKCVMNKDFADGNACEKCFKYNERADEAAKMITEAFINILELIKETIKNERKQS